MDKLFAVVTGPEHCGTTYIKNLLESLPDIFCGFECGVLLDKNFQSPKCYPWNEWIYGTGTFLLLSQ